MTIMGVIQDIMDAPVWWQVMSQLHCSDLRG